MEEKATDFIRLRLERKGGSFALAENSLEGTVWRTRCSATCAPSTPGEPSMPERSGFVGLDIIGLPMARNLMRAGHELVLHKRTRRRAEELTVEGGAEVADKPCGGH